MDQPRVKRPESSSRKPTVPVFPGLQDRIVIDPAIHDGKPVSNMHNRSTDIELDSAKAGENLRKHGVRFADTEQAFRDPNAVTVEDPDVQGEQRLSRWEWTRWGGFS